MAAILLSSDTGVTYSTGSSCRSSHIYTSARLHCVTDANDDKELLLFYCGVAHNEELQISSDMKMNWGWQLSLFGPPGQRRLRFCSSDGLFDIIARDSFPPASWEKVLSATVCEQQIGYLSVLVAVNGVLVNFMHMEDIRAQRLESMCSTCVTLPFSQNSFAKNKEVFVIGAVGKKSKRTFGGALDDPNDSHIVGITGSAADILILLPGTEPQQISSLFCDDESTLRTRAAPLRSFEQALLWNPSPCIDSPLLKTSSLKARFSNGLVSPSGPLSLLCHDCGPTVFVEDAEVGYSTTFHKLEIDTGSEFETLTFGHTYRLENFSGCDVFVYFSHNRVTIPPPSWISASHVHGTRVLGTIITEWKDGEAANQLLLRAYETIDSPTSSYSLAFKLASIAKYYGFDGWLVNIEAPLASGVGSERVLSEVSKLCAFLKDLTKHVHSIIGAHGIVLWYDSIDAKTGTVRWQSELNESNLVFFDQVDGIFLDYHWNEEKVRRTSTLAKSLGRCRDVFVGSDIWGRGSFGGEGFHGVRAAARAVKAASLADDDPPLSFALFGPAWSYESQGGSTDITLFRTLEEELWWGSDNRGSKSSKNVFDKISVDVLNPSGISLLPSQRAALGGTISQAMTLIGLAGWKVEESGGSGWSVESDDKSSCFVTSFAWSWSSQIVPLPVLESTIFDLCVEEEYCGTEPNVNDLYQLRATILDTNGKEISTWDSGELVCSATWQTAKTIFHKVDPSARSVRIQHGGRDAENWAGHFGAKMRNTKVFILTPCRPTSASGTNFDRFIDLVGGARPAASSLPLLTNFNCGAGAARFEEGRELTRKPWVDYSTCDLLPTYLGIASSISKIGAGETNGSHYLTSSLIHSTAWQGGTSLLVSSKDDSTQPSSVSRTNEVVSGKVRIFKLDIPVDRNEKIEIRLVHKTLSSHACELTPVLVFSNPEFAFSLQKISCEDIDAWKRSVFICTVGETAGNISELQLSLSAESSHAHNDVVKFVIGQIIVL